MTTPSLCLGIVTRNRAEILPKALASALSQRTPNLEITVIDDGSTDSTDKISAHYSQVRWIRRRKSLGYMSARNELMIGRQFDYFISLDDDAWFIEGDEIALAINYLEKDGRAGAVAFDILSPDRPDPQPRERPHPTGLFIGCGHALRMAAVRQVGYYEPTPGSYGGEEKDLCLRLLDRGYEIVRLPGVHVWHNKTPVARHVAEQHRSGVCNDLAIMLRRTPLSLLPAALSTKLYRHLRFSWQHDLTRPCLQGFGLFFRSVPAIWGTRRPVMATTLRTFRRLARS